MATNSAEPSHARWDMDQILSSLRAVPDVLKTQEHADHLSDAIRLLQDPPSRAHMKKIAPAATKELLRVAEATSASPKGRKFADEVLFALKLLSWIGGKPGARCISRLAQRGYAADEFMWSTVTSAFGEGHPSAPDFFKAVGRKLPGKFLNMCILDAANSAAREHGLKKHPFDTPAGVKVLAGYLSSKKEEDASYAVSSAASLPFIAKARRGRLVERARKHQSAEVRLEAAWATAKVGDKAGLAYLVEQSTVPASAARAAAYLTELGRKKLIPKSAREPDFVAMAEMAEWLAHPAEYGEAPTSIALMDKRKIYWPPTRDTRELRLFAFTYDRKPGVRPGRETGVGMVGSITWAFFDETRPTMKPEDIYGIHCCWELQANEDPRAPKKVHGKTGWKLIADRA